MSRIVTAPGGYVNADPQSDENRDAKASVA